MRHRFRIAFSLGLVAYAAFVAAHTSPVASGSDSAGYLLSARLLTEGRLTTALRTVPDFPPVESWENTPLGMIYSDQGGALVPTYPVGMPLLHAASSAVFGWHWGPVLVATLMAVGALLATFACIRALHVRRELALVGAAALAACPLVFYTTFQPLSDTASAFAVALTLFLALRAGERRSAAWAVAVGASVAFATLLRPSNILVVLPAVVALRGPRLWLAAVAGGLPGALFLGWYQYVQYGGVLSTGYGPVWEVFALSNVAPSLHQYLVWLPVFLPVGAAGMLMLPWLPWRSRAREIAVLLMAVLGFAMFYAFYAPTHESRWYLRFVLPACPAWIALAMLALESILVPLPTARCRVIGRSAVAAALAVSVGFGAYHWHTEGLGKLARNETSFRELPEWVDARAPRDAVILTLYASGSFYFYTERAIVRSDVIKPERLAALVQVARRDGRAIYAAVVSGYDDAVLRVPVEGAWREERTFGRFTLWRLEPRPEKA